jgi:hypothetical protein
MKKNSKVGYFSPFSCREQEVSDGMQWNTRHIPPFLYLTPSGMIDICGFSSDIPNLNVQLEFRFSRCVLSCYMKYLALETVNVYFICIQASESLAILKSMCYDTMSNKQHTR